MEGRRTGEGIPRDFMLFVLPLFGRSVEARGWLLQKTLLTKKLPR
jgi:hypothetical protein